MGTYIQQCLSHALSKKLTFSQYRKQFCSVRKQFIQAPFINSTATVKKLNLAIGFISAIKNRFKMHIEWTTLVM